jgi:hypothetical protein
MAEQKQPEFYGEAPSGKGQKVAHGAGRQARLEAEGIGPGKPLADAWREKADAAFAAGSQEDPNAEFQRVSSKQGRGNVEMQSKDILQHAQELAKQSGRPISPSGLVQEPVTEGKNSGYSDEKKAALAKSKKSSKKKGD